jgi:hypothetical protein
LRSRAKVDPLAQISLLRKLKLAHCVASANGEIRCAFFRIAATALPLARAPSRAAQTHNRGYL